MVMSRERKADPALFPEWLQILRPKRDDGESTDSDLSMTGRVKKHVSAEASALAEQGIGVWRPRKTTDSTEAARPSTHTLFAPTTFPAHEPTR